MVQTTGMANEHGAAEDRPASVLVCKACGRKNRIRPSERGTPHCGACEAALPWLVNATDATFDIEARASVPVLVDLWAPWCGPCHMIAPVLEKLAHERAGRLKVAKVNVDENPGASARYAVQSIPLLVLTRDGAEIGRLTGAVPPAQLRNWLDTTLQAAPA